MMQLDTHLNEGSNGSYYVIESSPSLTGGRTNLKSVYSIGILLAYRPRYMSESEKWRGVWLSSNRHN